MSGIASGSGSVHASGGGKGGVISGSSFSGLSGASGLPRSMVGAGGEAEGGSGSGGEKGKQGGAGGKATKKKAAKGESIEGLASPLRAVTNGLVADSDSNCHSSLLAMPKGSFDV